MFRSAIFLIFVLSVNVGYANAQERATATLYSVVMENFEVVFGYQLDEAEKDGSNFITCSNNKIKVKLELLQEQSGPCEPSGGGSGAFAGIIDAISPDANTVTLETYDGDIRTFEWADNLPELTSLKPGDNVFFSSKDYWSNVPLVADAHRLRVLTDSVSPQFQ